MSFKDKPLKKIVADKRVTIDAIHQGISNDFTKEKSEYESNCEKMGELEKRYKKGKNEGVKNEIEQLRKKIDEYDPKLTENLMDGWMGVEGRFDTMRVVRFGGAIAEVAENETAWVGRNAKWDIEVGGHWSDREKNEEYTQWGRDYWKNLTPYCAERIYINELMDEDQDFVATSYGQNYGRLVEIKNKYDPKNLFRLNGNIKPSI